MLEININRIIPIMADYKIIEGCRKDSLIYANGGYTTERIKMSKISVI